MPEDLSDDELIDELRAVREEDPQLVEMRKVLHRTQAQLAQARDKKSELVQATIQAAKDAVHSYGPLKPVPVPPRDRRKGRNEVALWHLTDWQGAKVTTSYNSEVMRQRVLMFADKAAHITDIQRADHPVRDCAIMFGGDMIEGLFNYPTQPYEIDATLFAQFVTVANLLAEVVRRSLAIYQNVEVFPEWGNHGRLGSKRDAVPRSDNADRMTYELARAMLVGESRLVWHDCPEDIQQVEIGNYRALLIHGDEIGRSGFASPMTIVRHADRWASGAYPWEFRDLYVGHYHTHAEWPMANGLGTVFQSGSTESDNRYARETMAASAIPSQRLHFVDPVKGRVTAQYKVYLDAA